MYHHQKIDTIRVDEKSRYALYRRPMGWADNAIRIMKRKNLRQEDMKKSFGVTTRGAVGHYFNGRRKPSIEQLQAVAEKLEVGIADLIGEDYVVDPDIERFPVVSESSYPVPRFAAQGAMGPGMDLQDRIEVMKAMRLDIAALSLKCSFTSRENLAFISGIGHSMEPKIHDGDVLLIDCGVEQIEVDAIFAVDLNGKFYIKMFQRNPRTGGLIMISLATQYQYELTEGDQLKVHGRIVLVWNANRL